MQSLEADKIKMLMQVPSSYLSGYKKVRASNPGLADRYVAHTLIGDPKADALVEELAGLDQEQLHRSISACMDGEELSQTPEVLRQFFRENDSLPEWYQSLDMQPGCSLFLKHSDLFLTAFVVSVIIRGFTTLISLSFFTTSRILDYGVRRLRQNIKHLLEIMIPGGLEQRGDGWKLSTRIRLVHAQARKLIADSGQWDSAAHGLPISAAHVGYAAASFSAMMLQEATRLGMKASAEERASFMHIWRCSAWLMGVPDQMLFRDEKDALEIIRVGLGCEPAFDIEGIFMANALINSAPLVVGVQDTKQRREMVKQGYRLARVMLGDEMSDKLKFPKYSTFGVLALMKTTRRIQEFRQHVPFLNDENIRFRQFSRLLDISMLDEQTGLSYRLPDHYIAELSAKW